MGKQVGPHTAQKQDKFIWAWHSTKTNERMITEKNIANNAQERGKQYALMQLGKQE